MTTFIQRPKLTVSSTQIVDVANQIAVNSKMRDEFIADPVLFLSKMEIQIVQRGFSCEKFNHSSEICTGVAVCVAVAAIAAALAVIAGVAVAALEVAISITAVYGAIVLWGFADASITVDKAFNNSFVV